MRVMVSAFCMAAALLLIAASIAMNWSFWAGQGSDDRSAQILGAVSIGIDVFKAVLPLVIAWAWSERFRLGYAVGTVYFCGCLIFSLFSAIGFASSSRGAVNGNREAISLRYAAAQRELKGLHEQLAGTAATRSVAVIEEAIARARHDRRWSSSNGCEQATVEASRQFCREYADLRIELASATDAVLLRERSATLRAELARLMTAGAMLEQDPQAGLLARLSGLDLKSMQTLLVVLTALLVEIGAAFGLFFAMLPLRGRRERIWDRGAHARDHEILPPLPTRAKDRTAPTRFVRASNGQLMIE